MTRILLLHLPGLDIRQWRERGTELLPQLIRAGLAETVLAVPHPLAGIAASTSLATGALPEEHGVWSEEEGWPLGTRRTSQASWSSPPLWLTLAKAGLRTGSVNWSGGAPAAAWDGLHVDERAFAATGRSWDDWVMPPDCCPPAFREQVREQRVHPAELSGEALLPFVPRLAELDQERTHAVEAVARTVAVAACVQAAATHFLDQDLAFLAVHLPIVDVVARLARQFAEIEPDAAYRFADAAIAHLLKASSGRWQVVLVGQGGRGASAVALSTTAVGLPPVMALTDLAPVLLLALGVSAAERRNPSYARPIPPRRHGYEPAAGPAVQWQVAHRLRLARLLVPRAPRTAAEIVDAVLAVAPHDLDALRLRALLHAGFEEHDALARIGKTLRALAPDQSWGAVTLAVAAALSGDKQQARELLTGAKADDDYDSLYRLGAAWLLVGEGERARPSLARAEQLEPARPEAVLGLAQIELAQRQLSKAEARLRRFVDADPGHPAVLQTLAEALFALGRAHEARQWEDAAEALRTSLLPSATPPQSE